MREIKFRAWDFVNKIMDEDIFIDGAGNAYDYASTTYNTPNTEIQRCEFPVMQYTGLKDKYGVEIYEGDILSYFGFEYEVIFEESAFGSYEGGQFYAFAEMAIDEIAKTKIIGNRYENPELSEGNQ